MKEQKVFEVSVIEKIEDLHEGSGVLKKIKRKVHLFRSAIVSTSADGARAKAIGKLTKKMTEDAAEEFIDSLEVSVTSPF